MIKTFVRAALDEQNTMKKAIVDSVSYIGCVIWCAGNVTPDNTIYCDGSAISRTTYAELFDAIGTTYGAGDGSSTFNIPDLRGYFIRGTGGNAGTLGAEQGDAIRDIRGHVTAFSSWDSITGVVCCIAPEIGEPQNNCFSRGNTGTNAVANLQSTGQTVTNYGLFFRASDVVPTAAENRPINYAMRPCIIFE